MSAAVAHIIRHPIKSHGREALESVELKAGATMPWDRAWAVAHERSEADGSRWEPCVNFSRGSKAPGIMAIGARLDESRAEITLEHPDLGSLTFRPDAEEERFLEWVAPAMPEDRARSARIVRVPGRGMTDTDYPSVSICGLSSNRAVGQKLGREISFLRWRANIAVEGIGPWEEFGWIGKTLAIGGARLRVRERIERCRATEANPETGVRDAETLQALESGWGHLDFGVYAEVEEGGEIRVGDPVAVL